MRKAHFLGKLEPFSLMYESWGWWLSLVFSAAFPKNKKILSKEKLANLINLSCKTDGSFCDSLIDPESCRDSYSDQHSPHVASRYKEEITFFEFDFIFNSLLTSKSESMIRTAAIHNPQLHQQEPNKRRKHKKKIRKIKMIIG